MKRTKMLTLLVGITTVASGAVALGYEWPPYPTRSEFTELAGMSYTDLLVRAETRYYHLDRQIKAYEARNQKPPNNILSEYQALARKIAKLKRLLENKR